MTHLQQRGHLQDENLVLIFTRKENLIYLLIDTVTDIVWLLWQQPTILFSLVNLLVIYLKDAGNTPYYRGADKSLARPGRKKAKATEDVDVYISYL